MISVNNPVGDLEAVANFILTNDASFVFMNDACFVLTD